MLARIFVDKMEHFFLKRRLDEDDFENYFETLFPPVNEGVDKVASTFSEFLIPIVNQQVKRKNKQKKPNISCTEKIPGQMAMLLGQLKNSKNE